MIEAQTVRQWNSAKAKLQKAIKFLDEAANLFPFGSIRRMKAIKACQQAEDLLNEMNSPEVVVKP